MSEYYEVTTPAASDPVTLTDVKNFCRDVPSTDDSLVTSLITAATLTGESCTNRVFARRTIDGYFTGLLRSNIEVAPFLKLHRAPVISVASLEVYDGTSWSTVPATDYALRNTNGGFPRIVFSAAPSYDTATAYPIKVTFDAGSDSFPEAIKTAIKQTAAFWYENRGDVMPDGELGLPVEVRMIYRKNFKIVDTF